MGRVGGIGSARKHHPYRKEEAPYPRSYEREVLDLDVWENLFCKQICGSLTWHEFEQPPTKVLDIGCGTGSWILDCAIVWRHCHFVGLDIVPLHPDLKQVGSNDLAQRITWIQDNFLDGLPFPNEEFDFVHIKRIARGVPEDKWDFLFEEITRVMKPSGAFEMIEEDLFFPGYRDNSNDEDEDGANNSWSQDSRRPILRRASIGTNRGSFPSAIQRSSGLMAPSGSDISDIDYDLDSESAFTSSAGSGSLHRLSNELSTPSLKSAISPVVGSTIGTLASPQTKAMTPITSLGREVGAIVEDEEGELRAGSGMGTPPEDIQRHDRFGTNSTVRPDTVTVCSPKGNPNLNGQSMSVQSGESSLNNGSGPPNSTNNQSSVAPFLLRSSLSSSNSRASLDSQPHFPLLQHRVAASIPHHRSAIFSNVNPNEQLSQQVSEGTTIAPISPFVLRQLPKPPVNPRDHSLLEMIYNEMHSSRFINLSPLSILPNTLGLYFKDVRTHPPLQFKFPPRAVPLGSGLRTADQAHDSYHPEYDENEGRDAIPTLPMVTEPRARRHSSAAPSQKHFFVSNPPNGGLDGREDGCDEDNFLTVRSLIRGTSPYISLDDSPPAAFSPSARASFLRSPLKQRIEFPLSDSERAGRASPDSLEAVNATPFSVAASVSMLRSRLPNKRLNVDLRSLNLHLCARVAEVLACTETMWEWVQEYQEKIRVEKATRTQRTRSKSVDVHPRFITPAPETTSDRLMAAVGRLAREEFEDLLLRFYLDMQDHVGIDHAIQKRFGWSTLRTSPTAERKSFDDACKRYALWEQDQQARRVDRPHASSRTWTRPLSASYTSNFSPLDSLTSPPEAVFQLEPATSEGGASNLTPRPSADTSRGRPRRERSSSYSAPRSQTPHVSSEPNRLSRAMRVFVAWKSD
ncbi:hypothetical protein E1B28_012345 [Marasmius oreades]|nr:uncharacterized protein E1B28_012345 [Marasmius oreades]KAG7088341.1 hypothetical protein E1B28_012345 [Marasmius oreades]